MQEALPSQVLAALPATYWYLRAPRFNPASVYLKNISVYIKSHQTKGTFMRKMPAAAHLEKQLFTAEVDKTEPYILRVKLFLFSSSLKAPEPMKIS